MLVTHKQVWKPAMFGGVTSATLCGTKSVIESDKANMNVGDDVTCKNCLAILSGKRRRFTSQFVDLTYEQVEQLAAQ